MNNFNNINYEHEIYKLLDKFDLEYVNKDNG